MENGIYTDITIEDYHKNDTHISATIIKQAKKSLKLMDWYRRGLIVQEGAPHFDFGNAFELALLDKQAFSEKVAITKDSEWVAEALAEKPALISPRKSGYYQGKCSEFHSLHEGKYIIADKGPESWESIQHMLESCFQDAVIQRLISGTEYQLSLFWTDPETGLNLKTRPDICKRKRNVIVNLKTALDGSPQAFNRDMAKLDYPIQAAVEIQGCLKSGLMDTVDNYFWLVVEKTPPFNATVYEFATKDIEMYTDNLFYLLTKIKKAKEQNFWPGYTEQADNEYGILTAEIPLWYR